MCADIVTCILLRDTKKISNILYQAFKTFVVALLTHINVTVERKT